MFNGLDIICVSSIDWDFLWQQHQEIMSAFARGNNRVLFIENTGVRSPRLSRFDINRILHRVTTRWHAPRGFRRMHDRLDVYSPLVLPFPYSRVAQRVNRRILVAAVRSWMRSVGAENPILWTFLPTQITLDLMREVPHRLLVYYCTDNFAATSAEASQVLPTEREVIRSAQAVFAMSQAMAEHCHRYNDAVVRIPMGVNLERFERVREGTLESPDDLRGCRPPIIGYVGGVRHTIDQELIKRVARERPDWTLVFVGPIQMPIAELSAYPNIRFLGAKAHEEVARYIRAFDCCILPYVKNAYTDSVSPAKLFEYLIMGKPVVATDIAELAPLAASQSRCPIVYVAPDSETFLRYLDLAVTGPDGHAEARIAAARQQGWDRKIEMIATVIEERLGACDAQTVRVSGGRAAGGAAREQNRPPLREAVPGGHHRSSL